MMGGGSGNKTSVEGKDMSLGTRPSGFKSWLHYQLWELGKLLRLLSPLRGLSFVIYKMEIMK